MTRERETKAFNTVINTEKSNTLNSINIPLIAGAFESWQLATSAFADKSDNYRKKQQYKSAFHTILNPRFTYKWFEILKSPDFLLVTTHRKCLYLKPYRVYMSIHWTKDQRCKVIQDTYRFIMAKGEVFAQVITNSRGMEIATIKLSDTVEGTLILGYDEKFRKEGELVFSFESQQLGGRIVAAAFSFEETEKGSWICRIGCIQGHGNEAENASKIAQKLLNGLRPKSLIVFAIQEFSRHLGLTAVYGAGDSIQAYRGQHAIHLPWLHTIDFDYDSIWNESSATLNSDGWFELPLTPARKSYEEIKSHKRALYRRRYAQLDELSSKIADAVKTIMG